MTTTFRTDTRAGMVTAVNAFITAHPTLLLHCYTARPTSFTGDMPFAYIDLLNETATHSLQIRTRNLNPSVVVVARPLDNPAQVAAWDILVDLLADHFTAYAHLSPGTIWDAWTVTEDTVDIETQTRAGTETRTFPYVRFTFDNVSIGEGRSP